MMCVVLIPVTALEFMPYPAAKISNEEWQAFYERARSSLGHTQRTYTEQNMVVFLDSFNGHHYAFTLPGHAAHPSWIARRIVNHDGKLDIQQVGYYVVDETAFIELFRSYLELNDQIREKFEKRHEVETDG
jgi:hypothetical protein